jgi:hypothetical protein
MIDVDPNGPRVVGLDLSSTSTGACHPDGVTELIVREGGTWLYRAQEMRDAVTPIVEGADLVLIEDIVIYGKAQPSSIIPLCYVHCQVDARLVAKRIRFRKYSPDQVKMFGTGRRCSKEQLMVAAARHGWDERATSTNDESDAWWLWILGNALMGTWLVEPTQFRRDVVAKILRSAHRL